MNALLLTLMILPPVVAPMQLRSADFSNGATIPRAFTARRCGGAGRSPALAWRHVPLGTRSFALIMHDVDAPRAGGFDHWVLYDIPAQTRRLAENAAVAPARVGLATTGKADYVGPCPPPGPTHHYVITLYALDEAHVPAPAPLDAPALRASMQGHVLGSATLTGLVAKPTHG